MILAGIFLFGLTLSSLAKREMTESFVLIWGLISMIFILSGILLKPVEWKRYISDTGLILLGLIGFSVVFGAYFTSIRVSELMRENLELAMQLSLVEQELQALSRRLGSHPQYDEDGGAAS